MELILAVIFIMLLYFLKEYVKIRRYIKLMKRFPHPPTVPIFGNALSIKSPKDIIPKFAEYLSLYGNKVTLYFGMLPNTLLITDHGLATHVLSSNKILKKGNQYTFLSKWLGKGLLTSYGDNRWRHHRKLINPSFHIQILKEFIQTYQSNAEILIKILEQEVGNPSFDVHPYATACSLDIICETAMGTRINSQYNNYSDYVKSVKLMCGIIIKRGFNAFLRTDFFYRFSKLYKEEQRAIKILHEHTENVIKQKKLKTNNIVDGAGRKPKMALLDSLLQLNKEWESFTDVQIRDEVNTFMFAGHDTSASALTFSIYALAEYSTVQAKVVEELDEIFGDDKERSITLNDIQSMRYMEAFIKEVIRMYPPVAFVSRIVEEDFDYDGYTIPEGCSLIIYIYGMHHDPKLFPKPDYFDPERFLGESADENFNCGFLPFGFGPRNCIGQKFAMLELKTVLAVLLRHYRLGQADPPQTLELTAEGIVVPTNGAFISLSIRKC